MLSRWAIFRRGSNDRVSGVGRLLAYVRDPTRDVTCLSDLFSSPPYDSFAVLVPLLMVAIFAGVFLVCGILFCVGASVARLGPCRLGLSSDREMVEHCLPSAIPHAAGQQAFVVFLPRELRRAQVKWLPNQIAIRIVRIGILAHSSRCAHSRISVWEARLGGWDAACVGKLVTSDMGLLGCHKQYLLASVTVCDCSFGGSEPGRIPRLPEYGVGLLFSGIPVLVCIHSFFWCVRYFCLEFGFRMFCGWLQQIISPPPRFGIPRSAQVSCRVCDGHEPSVVCLRCDFRLFVVWCPH